MDRRTMLQALSGAALLFSAAAFSRTPRSRTLDITGQLDVRAYLRERRNPHVERAMAQAASSYRADAIRGNADAQVRLALMYRHGWGVDASDVQSTCWFRQAAAQGHPKAQHELALAYQYGIGVRPDPVRAAAWLDRSHQAKQLG